MAGPFSSAVTTSLPAWGAIVPANGNFVSLSPLQQQSSDEVGYGEGGYGEGGYDTPSITTQPAPTPIWTVEVVR